VSSVLGCSASADGLGSASRAQPLFHCFFPLNILYLITRSDQIGGAHIHVRDLALHFQQSGHDVTIMVGGTGFYYHHLIEQGLRVVSVPHLKRPINIYRDFMCLWQIKQIIDSAKPDIISAHSAKAGILLRLLFDRHSSSKYIFTAHGWSFAPGIPFIQRSIYKLVEKAFALRCHKIVCVCRADIDFAVSEGLALPTHFRLIHNGMPDVAPSLTSPARSISDFLADPIRLICVARFEMQKDHRTLFSALANLQHLNWHLALVGDGPKLSVCMDYVATLGLEDRVEFCGRSTNVALLLHNSDIFVLPSLWEGFPRSILEALRASLPIIATDVGGVKESVRPGFNGFTPSVSSVDEWVKSLTSLISSPSLCSHYGANSRKLFLSHFLFDEMARKTASLYLDLIKA
jgi:glycosyltransferase involved in cell wall biosynthesis